MARAQTVVVLALEEEVPSLPLAISARHFLWLEEEEALEGSATVLTHLEETVEPFHQETVNFAKTTSVEMLVPMGNVVALVLEVQAAAVPIAHIQEDMASTTFPVALWTIRLLTQHTAIAEVLAVATVEAVGDATMEGAALGEVFFIHL